MTAPTTHSLFDPCVEDEAQRIGYSFTPDGTGVIVAALFSFPEYAEFCPPRVMTPGDARKLYRELLREGWTPPKASQTVTSGL